MSFGVCTHGCAWVLINVSVKGKCWRVDRWESGLMNEVFRWFEKTSKVAGLQGQAAEFLMVREEFNHDLQR